MLVTTPILTLSIGGGFVVYNDASKKELGVC